MKTHLSLDLYILLLLESGILMHYNGTWVGNSIEYKNFMLNMINKAYNLKK